MLVISKDDLSVGALPEYDVLVDDVVTQLKSLVAPLNLLDEGSHLSLLRCSFHCLLSIINITQWVSSSPLFYSQAHSHYVQLYIHHAFATKTKILMN